MIREVGPRVAGGVDDANDFFGPGEVSWLVVETCGHSPRALIETRGDHAAHALDLFGRRTSIGIADDRLPDGVEANVAADVERQASLGKSRHLAGDVERAVPIRVENLRRHALRQHVDGRGKRIRRGVAVNIDEAGRHDQAPGVDCLLRRRRCKIADGDDEPVADADVGGKPRIAAAVDDGSAAHDHIESRCLRIERNPQQQHQ